MASAMKALRKMALRLPEVEEGVACEGTALEKRTVKVAKKAFLFLGTGDVLLKLERSLDEARKLASKAPERIRVGVNGWVKITFSDADPPPSVVEKWIAESHALASSTAKAAAPKKKKAAASKKKKAT